MTERDINIEETENLADEQAEVESVNQADENIVADTEDGESEETEAKDEADADAEATDEVVSLKSQVADLQDKYLRSVAEFDNYRKRTLKERAELILNGGEKVLTAILPVVDDMERAIENGEKTEDPQVLREGMELIYNKLMKVMEAQGVSRIETEDADFDTDVHEAVAMVPGMGDDKKGKVIDCLQKGYKLNDKVIRHAKVAVGQ